MYKIFIFACLATVPALASCRAQRTDESDTLQVRVTGGLIEGVLLKEGMRVFKGVPFAAPPVGALRWKPPQPVRPWEGIRQAKEFGPSALQLRSAVADESEKFNEDCLYLNVWTPARTADERLPVMVYIHGGGFREGSTAFPVLDGANLAAKGVVVVTIAYRLGPFGFLAHPELSKEGSGGSGNFGIRDQIASLEWVRDNIAAFGGDPKCVTVFGCSAGAISVSVLAASPSASGLFHRAIAQSGAAFFPPNASEKLPLLARPLKRAERDGEALLAKLGAKDIAAARALPADAISMAGGGASVVIDGDELPDDLFDLYEAGKFNDTPVLVGSNSGDGAQIFASLKVSPEIFEKLIRFGMGELAENVLSAYSGASPAENLKAKQDLIGDVVFRWPVWTWASLQTTKGRARAFVYYFDHHPPEQTDGAAHGAENSYVLRNLEKEPRTSSAKDKEISELMSSYWVNFAKTGDPNGPGLPVWSAFSSASPEVMTIDATPGMEPIPRIDRLKALDALFESARRQAK